MKLYRVNKLAKPNGVVVKTKHILAGNDREAVREARERADCPVCEVFSDGRRVGVVL